MTDAHGCGNPNHDHSKPFLDYSSEMEWIDQMKRAMMLTAKRVSSTNSSDFMAPESEAWDNVVDNIKELAQVYVQTLHEQRPDVEMTDELLTGIFVQTMYVLGRTFQELETVRLLELGKLDHLMESRAQYKAETAAQQAEEPEEEG